MLEELESQEEALVRRELKKLETPAFLRAYNTLTENRPIGLTTVARMEQWLTDNVDIEAAAAWRAYKDLENTMP